MEVQIENIFMAPLSVFMFASTSLWIFTLLPIRERIASHKSSKSKTEPPKMGELELGYRLTG